MIENKRVNNILAYVSMFAVILLLFAGCSTLKTDDKDSFSTPSFFSFSEKKDVPSYHDFGDVLIPKELKMDKNSSFIYTAPGFSAGVLALNGRVEVSSLCAFFEENMTKDNWKLIVSFKSSRTIMLFQKENRWCVINITDGQFSTSVEIWVAPTVTEGARGLLK
ncbi:MAG: hypothetical protein KKE00_07565 [Proteobacteria bacterium]|nr:hypothetical protein [Pseudomonadota bacterium]MBU1570359.1 hypothetical protein [Pseudomonadota bacterium]